MAAVRSECVRDVLVVRIEVSRHEDTSIGSTFCKQLFSVLDAKDIRAKLLLDMSGVAAVSSATTGTLLAFQRKCVGRGICLRLCELEPDVALVFQLMRLTDLLQAFPDRESALAEFPEPQTDNPIVANRNRLESEANQGDADAQYNLGNILAEGRYGEQELDTALERYAQAAHSGHPEAQFELGRWFAYGVKVDCDYDEALKWYRKAADQGHANAQYELGVSLEYGLAAPDDSAVGPEQAAHWYRLAARQGHAAAIAALRRLEGSASAQ